LKLSKQVHGTLIATVIEKIYLFFKNLFVVTMYKNNILISLIFRPLETVEEDSCTELIQVNKRSRLQPEQSNNQGYNVQLQNCVHRTFQLLFSSYEMVLKQVDHAYWVLYKKEHSVSKRHHHLKLSKQVHGT
jgi:hypothetical protein